LIEELKELVQVVNSLPQLALWVAIGFWAYKVIIIGSVYGVIRLAIQKAHSVLTKEKVVVTQVRFKDLTIINEDALKALLVRVINRPGKSYPDAGWFYSSDHEWLLAAVDEKIEREAKK